MKKYSIKHANKDFRFLEANYNAKGSRAKKMIIDVYGNMAFFKYQGIDYKVSEAASEKMSYEIAVVLGFPCAKIELAYDKEGKLGVLNYLFNEIHTKEHIDAVSFLKRDTSKTRKDFYTLENIKLELDKRGSNLFEQFIQIMVFDALVGEQDRHEENWGLTEEKQKYTMSPLYDNGCNLLREFRNDDYANDYYTGKKDFASYIRRSRTLIYKEDHKTRYRHFELIEHLLESYPEYTKKYLKDLTNLTDELVDEIVDSVPDELLSTQHKNFIKEYIKVRREILLKHLKEDD